MSTRTYSYDHSSCPDATPLGIVLHHLNMDGSSFGLKAMVPLLRAGASLDRCMKDKSAEEIMRGHLMNEEVDTDDEDFTRCQGLVAGVREHGSYKRYLRAPHRHFLRLRSLLVRGRAETADRRLERIARLPNGAVWNVLSYWREAE